MQSYTHIQSLTIRNIGNSDSTDKYVNVNKPKRHTSSIHAKYTQYVYH